MCQVPPGVSVLMSVERPTGSFSFYSLHRRSLMMALKSTAFVSHTLKLQCKSTQVTGGRQNTGERVLCPDTKVLCDGCEQKGGYAIIPPGNAAAVWSPLQPLAKR